MSIELIRGELERLYSLEEMLTLSSDLLGFEPTQVGGTASTASFARALTEHCQQHDAIAALIDAVTGTRHDASPKLQTFVEDVLRAPVELKPGTQIGAYEVVRKLGVGPNGTVYLAKKDGTERVIKLLHNAALHDKVALYRFLTRNRLLARVEHPNLPTGLEAGFIDDKPMVAYDTVGGKPLGPRIKRTGALHINEARPLLHALLEAIKAIHDDNLVHGAIKLENVLVGKKDESGQKLHLVDAGGDLLRSSWVHSDVGSTGGDRIKGMAPEQLRGLGTVPASDMYGFGALLFEVLTGKPPFEAPTATAAAVAHLSNKPPQAKAVAPKGWVSDELNELCSKLLEKEPSARPTIDQALEVIGPVESKDKITDDELVACIDTLVADPVDTEAAIALEMTIERDADPKKVAEAFLMAAEVLDPEEAAATAKAEESSSAVGEAKAEAAHDRALEQKKGLIFRAARLFGNKIGEAARAEEAYKWLLELDKDDEVAQTGYEQALRSQEKLEELVEYLLDIGENSESHSERARALNKIGHIYAGPLDDNEQAVFAFAQALAQDIQQEEYAEDLERAAGDDMQLWAEAVQSLHEATEHPRIPAEVAISLFMHLGNWYVEKIARPDLAVSCFQKVLEVDPSHEGALEGMSRVYRRAQQWHELVQVLLMRVERAPTPERARDLRAEAASILDTRLDDLGRARDLYEANLEDDPGHQKTVEALELIYQRADDYAGYVRILDRQAEALTGRAKSETLCKIAEIYEDHLNDLAEAERRFQAAADNDPGNMGAIRGLDRIYNRTGRYQELLENLERQVGLAATPRQKINLFARIAGIYDEEYLDHEKAAEYLEKVLSLDPSHEGALTGLMRHYRALDRWDDVIDLYDRSLRVCTDDQRRIELLLAQGRVLLDFGSPERARLAYENVLQVEPGNAAALESLAHVRAATGDAMAALSAVESLAEKAEDSDQKADLWIRAAKILEEAGDRDGAIVRYKRALDAQPTNTEASKALREAYLARGDAQSAADIINQEIERTDGDLARARLHTELAEIKLHRQNDVEGGREAAMRALDLDPTNVRSLLLLGDIAFEGENFMEAADRYAGLAGRTDVLEPEDAKRALMRLVDALSKTGSTEKANAGIQSLLELAPDDPEALRRAARVRLDSGQFGEAVELYDELRAKYLDDMPRADQAQVLLEHGTALRKSGEPMRAIDPLKEANELKPDASEPVEELADVYRDLERWEDVVEVLQRRADVVAGEMRAELLLEIGEVLATHVKDSTRAGKTLVAALEENPENRRILTRLMKLYSEEKDWDKLIDVVLKLGEGVDDPQQKVKYIQTAAGVAAGQLEDYDRALGYLQQVLEIDPNNQKAIGDTIDALQKKGDHEGLVEFLLKRAEAIEDTESKVRLLLEVARIAHDDIGDAETAAMHLESAVAIDPKNPKLAFDAAKTAQDKLENLDLAAKHLERVLELEPENVQALQRAIEIREKQEDYDGVVHYLEIALEHAEKQKNSEASIKLLERIAKLYLDEIGSIEEGIAHLERAHKLDPTNQERLERLAELYAQKPDAFFDRAVDAQMALVRQNPFNAEMYRRLRKLYTGTKQADPAWCVCQALYVMNSAEPDEERFFQRMRPETAATARERLGDEDWDSTLLHPECNHLVTKIFQLIEPAVFARNAEPLEALGYQTAYALDLTMHPYPISQTLYYAGGVLGMEIPMTFQNINDPGGISFLHANPPCIVLGSTALAAELPTQAAAFIAARHLTYYRPGLYIRHLVPTGTGLRAWLFAAVKLFHDQFPLAEELESMVAENVQVLKQYVPGHVRETLASHVSKLLTSGAIDLKKWVAGVDLSADRAGFLVCHDLEVASEMIRASDESTAAVGHRDRIKELTLFAVDKRYFALRRRLGITIDA